MLKEVSKGLAVRFRKFPLAAAFVLLCGIGGISQTVEPAALVQGEPVSREIAAGQKHAFSLQSTAGQLVRGRVVQKGTDLIIRVAAAGDRWVAEFDSQLRPDAMETFEFVADETGAYRVEVEGKRGTTPGKYELAMLETTNAPESAKTLHEARVLLSKAASQSRAGKYADAISTAEQALKLREAVLGPSNREVAVILNRIGIYHFSAGSDERSFEYQDKARRIYESDPETDELVLAEVYNNLAVHLRRKGEFDAADQSFKRILEIREKVFGADSYPVSIVLNNYGILHRVRGDYEAAERTYERALRIRERLLGDDHIDLTPLLSNLAALAYYRGDFSSALAIDRRVLAIREKNLPSGHPSIAEATYNVAMVAANVEDSAAVEQMLLQSIRIYEKAFKPDSSQLIDNYATLGNLYRERGDLTAARNYVDRALRIAELHKATDPQKWADVLLYSARARILENDLKTAEKELNESLSIREKFFGPDHGEVREVLRTLAELNALSGKVPQAADLQARANKIGEKQLALNLVFGTEHQRFSLASRLNSDLEQTLDMHARLAPSNEKLRDMAATILIQRKGRVLDATTMSLSNLRKHSSSENAALFAKHRDTTARLTALMLAGPGPAGADKFEKDIAELQSTKDGLDRELSRMSAGFYQPPKAYTVDDINAAVPADSALIEFALVESKLGMKPGATPERQYVAYVFRPGESVGYVPLGDAATIDASVGKFRKALRDPLRTDVARLARDLDQKAFRPIRSLIGNAKHILLSPEGELSVIPFEALIDERRRYLVEEFQFTYLTSGRDLLRMGTSPQPSQPATIIANPAFSEAEDITVASSSVTPAGVKRNIAVARDLSEVRFVPLSGTQTEANAIQNLFPDAILLTGPNASVAVLSSLKAPDILHLATHGFFLEDVGTATGPGNRVVSGAGSTEIKNPLIRSGLALAGANYRMGRPDDGILTALEASGLNLWGTRLTVLSACDTGVGEIRVGEGVYGLRRAFTLAGTESLLMSLWPVSDLVTRELMVSYYKNLRAGAGRGAALRQVQLSMLKRPNRRHPFYWASFIHSGEWANLEGKR